MYICIDLCTCILTNIFSVSPSPRLARTRHSEKLHDLTIPQERKLVIAANEADLLTASGFFGLKTYGQFITFPGGFHDSSWSSLEETHDGIDGISFCSGRIVKRGRYWDIAKLLWSQIDGHPNLHSHESDVEQLQIPSLGRFLLSIALFFQT